MESNSFSYGKLFYSLSDNLSLLEDTRNKIFISSIETIYNYKYNHYFCNTCHKFPFIKFCKDRKNIRMTCSCFNNKKILIKELFKTISLIIIHQFFFQKKI